MLLCLYSEGIRSDMAEALSDYQFTVGAILFVWNYISFEFDDLTHGRRLVRGVGGIERNSSRLTVYGA